MPFPYSYCHHPSLTFSHPDNGHCSTKLQALASSAHIRTILLDLNLSAHYALSIHIRIFPYPNLTHFKKLYLPKPPWSLPTALPHLPLCQTSIILTQLSDKPLFDIVSVQFSSAHIYICCLVLNHIVSSLRIGIFSYCRIPCKVLSTW